MTRRTRHAALLASVLLGLLAAATAAPVAAVNDLTDGIAPGVIRDGGDFGTSTVIVPANGYVTYMAQGAPNLGGTPVEIWTNTTGEWTRVAQRSFAADGSIRYFARVNGRTGIRVIIPGTPGGSAHGRSAANWSNAADTRTKITVGCDDFEVGDSNVFVARTVALKSGSDVVVTLCSNVSTGFSWQAAAVDSARLRVLSHRYTAPKPTNPPLVGASGIETWTFRVSSHGEGRAVLSYDQPWNGGIKAAWIFLLETRS